MEEPDDSKDEFMAGCIGQRGFKHVSFREAVELPAWQNICVEQQTFFKVEAGFCI